MLSFVMHPKALSLALKNVLEFTSGNLRPYPHILIHAERDDRGGSLRVIGSGSALCARDWAEISGAEGDDVAAITVVPSGREKSDVVDDLQKLAMAIGKTSTAKSAQVFVTIDHRKKITVEYAGQLVGELADSGGDDNLYEVVEDHLDLTDWSKCKGPTAFMIDTIGRLTKIKSPSGGTVADVAEIKEGMVAVAVGPTFRGLMATVDRDLFAAGGPWRDGPGNPASLLGGVS